MANSIALSNAEDDVEVTPGVVMPAGSVLILELETIILLLLLLTMPNLIVPCGRDISS